MDPPDMAAINAFYDLESIFGTVHEQQNLLKIID